MIPDRTGQVWELHAHLGVPPRAALILRRVEQGNPLLGDVAWLVVMLTGDNPVLTGQQPTAAPAVPGGEVTVRLFSRTG